MSPEPDENQADEEHEELASRSIFAAGWFRAVLVLTVLAIVVVVSLPYLLNWFEPAAPPTRTAKPAEPPRSAPNLEPPPAPATPPPPAPKPSAVPAPPPPSVSAPAPKTVAETPAVAPSSSRKAASEKPAAEKAAAPAKPAAVSKVAKARQSPSRPASPPAAKAGGLAGGGRYWVQVGAFAEQRNADNLAKVLRSEGFPVEVIRITRSAGEAKAAAPRQHELFVTEAGVEKVNAALKGRGSAQIVPGGVSVKPAFPLQEAMAISKQLNEQGLTVIIRPAGNASPEGAGMTLHAVRAGGYPDRPRALAARDELQSKGHGAGFLTQGPPK